MDGAAGRASGESTIYRPTIGLVLIFVVIFFVVILVVLVVLVVLIPLFVLFELAAFGGQDAGSQLLRPLRFAQHVLLGDDVVLPQPKQALVQKKHAVFAPRLDAGVDAIR